MNNNNPSGECELCGGTSFYTEAGHLYCSECQTQSQQLKELVFEHEVTNVNKKSTKKIKEDKSKKIEDKLTSWECYNVILKGLTEELLSLGAKRDLKVVVRCLWMKYLHKCEVFDIKSDRPPKVSILGSKKDIDILYNVKKNKKRYRTSSTSTIQSVNRHRSNKKRALISSQYDELSQSQTLTQGSSLTEETLSTLKSPSEKNSEEISYNRFSQAQLKRFMSKRHRKVHSKDVTRQLSCHKLRARDFPSTFSRGPANLTPFTLFGLLYIALLIIEDPIQLGDLLRFIREGHLSFGCYRHFFDDNATDETLTLPRRTEKLFSNEYFRKKSAVLARFLNVARYVKRPDLVQLCSRYCTELNLPSEVFECVEKLIVKTDPRMRFSKNAKEVPNYEGRAISFILFALKLLFGLDGATETKMSEFAATLNGLGTYEVDMFVFEDWLKYLSYRVFVIRTYHGTPYGLNRDFDADTHLRYLKGHRELGGTITSKRVPAEAKAYLQILKQLGSVDGQHERPLEPSLTPFHTHATALLNKRAMAFDPILQRSFADTSIQFVLRPSEYLKMAGVRRIIPGGANDKIVLQDLLHVSKYVYSLKKSDDTVAVECVEDESIGELEMPAEQSNTANVDALLSNWQRAHKAQFLRNRRSPEMAVNETPEESEESGPSAGHYNAFERYWMNVPANPTVIRHFSKSRTDRMMEKMSASLRIVLKEFARVLEQELYDVYAEFLVTEINLVYCTGGYCGAKKRTGIVPGLKKVVKDCANRW